MITDSLINHQPITAPISLIRVCSQCEAGLDSKHPISSNMCPRCSTRWIDPHLPAPMKANGYGDKSDCAHRHPMKVSPLSMPACYEMNLRYPMNEDWNTLQKQPMTSLQSSPIPTSPTTVSPVSPSECLLSSSNKAGSSTLLEKLMQPPPLVSRPVQRPPPQTLHTEVDSSFPNHPIRSDQHGAQMNPWTTQPLKIPTKPQTPLRAHPNIRTCTTNGCTGLIVPSSTCLRCVKCVMADWKSRRAKLPNSTRSRPISILRTDPNDKGKRKSVSWADQQISDSWVSKIKRVRLKLPPAPTSSSKGTGTNRIGSSSNSSSENEDPLSVSDGNTTYSPPAATNPASIKNDTLASLFSCDSDLSDLTDSSHENSSSENNESSNESDSSIQSLKPDIEDKSSRLVIRIPSRTSSTVSSSSQSPSPEVLSPNGAPIPYIRCSASDCYRYLPPDRDKELCTWCFLRRRRRPGELKSIFPNQPNGFLDSGRGDASTSAEKAPDFFKLPVIVDLLGRDLLSDNVVTGARLCHCHHIIPPRGHYPYDECTACQIENRLKSLKEVSSQKTTVPADSVVGEEAIKVAVVKANVEDQPSPGRCRNRDCGVIVHGYPECWQCTTRRMQSNTNRGRTRESFDVPIPGRQGVGKLVKPTALCFNQKLQRQLNLVTPYPEYRCQHELLVDFHMRISSFLDAQTLYSFYRSQGNPKTFVFGFEGQFSVVIPEYDQVRRKDAVDLAVSNLKGELERLATLEFNSEKVVTANDSGIFMRFLCVHPLYDPFGPPYPDQQPTQMYGELEIAILPDHSHQFLPGRKTVVRCRLVR